MSPRRAAHRLPEHLHAPHGWGSSPAQRAQYLPGLEGVALPHVVISALHRANDLACQIGPACPAGMLPPNNPLSRVPHLARASSPTLRQARQYHLRLHRISAEKGFHYLTSAAAARKAASRPSPRDPPRPTLRVPSGHRATCRTEARWRCSLPFGLLSHHLVRDDRSSPWSKSDCSGERCHSSPKRWLLYARRKIPE